jgi:type I restriction enzyme M protein
MLTSETKRRIDACRDILVGKLPLPTDQVELITLALIYKFMDDLDEESVRLGGKRSFFTGELSRYRWRALLPQTVSAEDRVTLFSGGVEALGDARKAVRLPGLFRDIFRNAFLKFRDGRILTLFLTEINGFEYSHSEELGNAFEYLLQSMGTQGENGQFRTPRHIIDFMVACLEPEPDDTILDPACGTGGFLVSAYKRILSKYTSPDSAIPGDKLTHAQRKKVYANLAGYDITDLMVKLSKVNLFLHGFPDPAIHIYDTLSNDARWNEKADLILANPPFMTPKGGVTPHAKFRIAAKKAEVLFTDYIAEHLTPGGRGAVIVPNGIVATTQNAYVKLRRFLVEDSLVAVVSLPAGVFKPYSGVKTSILFLDKKLARQRKEILFLKIAADGFELGDKRTPIEANDLPEAERVVKGWLVRVSNDESRMAQTKGTVRRVIEKKELLKNHSVSLQVETFVSDEVAGTGVRMVSFRDLCLRMQYGISVPLNTDGKGTPCFRMNEIPGGVATDTGTMKRAEMSPSEFSKYRLNRGDLLFNRTNSFEHVGRTGIFDLPGDYVFASYLIRLEINRELADPRYINAFMNSARFQEGIKSRASRAVNQANISASALAGHEIPLPPLEEQQRIVAEIDEYQKEIARLEGEITANRERIQATIDAIWTGESE